ncbi:Arginyl-tRNA synthetase [hydrothermal vent metagenome]|uniref:arginine--tRNA ligase n=1 Tax=hydrothermal vent metagenome TaxID=652676 RepID=A0A3B1DYB2_9ZZZZ
MGRIEFKTQLKTTLKESLAEYYSTHKQFPPIELETPAQKIHGDYSCNIALRCAKILKKSPLAIAEELGHLFQKNIEASLIHTKIAKIEIKNPGFINFYLTSDAIFDILYQIFTQQNQYGTLKFGNNKKIQIEFVSANPTGPLSVAHARQAAVGDALVNILNFIGFEAKKEYYVNDGGNQIRILGLSIQSRALELLGENITLPEDGYQGVYIKDMAKIFLDQNTINTSDELKKKDLSAFMQFGKEYLLDVIRKELDDFGVHFDMWSYESKVATKEKILEVLKFLAEKSLTYEHEGALWFKSTDFGDDKDRVLRKSDGSYTYLTPDITYHKNKFERGFDHVFDILGPDHHGYIARITAAAMALGRQKEDLKVLIVQLATIYREGEKVSMSTRGGQYVTLREVIEEVGVDVARFFFLMRSMKAHLDFDLDLAKKQSSENPVYYIQYAHARIHSINKKASEANIVAKTSGISSLTETEELDLIKKLGSFPDVLLTCHDQLDPYPLVNYLQDVAAIFHKFYDNHRVVLDDQNLSAERLALINATRIVLANGLNLLGLSTPEKM